MLFSPSAHGRAVTDALTISFNTRAANECLERAVCEYCRDREGTDLEFRSAGSNCADVNMWPFMASRLFFTKWAPLLTQLLRRDEKKTIGGVFMSRLNSIVT